MKVLSLARLWLWVLSLASLFFASPSIATASADRGDDAPAMVRLPGYVLPALSKATIVPSSVTSETEPLTLTLVLKRDDQPSFERFLHDLYDPHSRNFHKFLTQRQIANRFGPSRAEYNSVLRWMVSKGFKLERGAKNRLTLTMRGTRANVERAFDVRIADYRIGSRTFRANDGDPALPLKLASRVQSIAGLSNLAIPSRSAPDSGLAALPEASAPDWEVTNDVCFPLTPTTTPSAIGIAEAGLITVVPPAAEVVEVACLGFAFASGWAYGLCSLLAGIDSSIWSTNKGCADFYNAFLAGVRAPAARDSSRAAPASNLGTNPQKIGLLEFDTFTPSDVLDWLEVGGGGADFGQLSTVPVDGGVATPGPGESEVLLDVDTVMSLAALPATSYVVYDAPNGTSFGTMFSAMIDDGDTVISNSWSECEDEMSLSEVQSIDTILQSAAAAGISVFNGSGDSGTTCLDGSANTIGVPADSPNATAVGGTSPAPGPGLTYGSETWWNGVSHTPPTGQGGYGVSKFFPAPAYQSGLSGSTMRSIPDVVIDADPAQGLQICQADLGGCLSGRRFGGTSMAAPEWAAYAAALNAMLGSNLGNANLHLYPLANTNAFHSAASLGSDFAHVGLGSPDFLQLRLALTGLSPGAASPSLSVAFAAGANADGSAPADGVTTALAQAVLTDTNGFPISGKSVSLTAAAGSATITPPFAVTDNDGAAVFSITDLNTENLTLTATDVTDSVILAQQPTLSFVPPPATSAGLTAFPTTVTADGAHPTTITVTLEDTLGRPSPGKQIQLNQTGNSVITGPIPQVTDSAGQIVFTGYDTDDETVTYTATDVTDGNLAFPETTQVTFSSGPETGCGNGNTMSAPGYLVTPYVTGLFSENFSYAGGDFGGCPGAWGLAFDASGNLYVGEEFNGAIYKIPSGGGAASASNLIGTIGPLLGQLVFDGGNLYAVRGSTGSNLGTGAVLQIDPSTGAVLNTVAGNLNCPLEMAVDPLSGDLFVDDGCEGPNGSGALLRISNLATTPTVSTYATLPNQGNYQITFAADGTIYVFGNAGDGQIVEVGGTAGTQPAPVNVLSGPMPAAEFLAASGTAKGGGAQFLIFGTAIGTLSDAVATLDLTTNPPSTGSILVNSGIVPAAENATFGPDGCLYIANGNEVLRISNPDGTCGFVASLSAPSLVLTPTTVSPNPPQGSAQTFTARFHNVTVTDGTPVLLGVTGANPHFVEANSVGGAASFTYTATHQGVDTISASATVASSSLVSNQAVITWGPDRM